MSQTQVTGQPVHREAALHVHSVSMSCGCSWLPKIASIEDKKKLSIFVEAEKSNSTAGPIFRKMIDATGDARTQGSNNPFYALDDL